jgi:hypothetical protein
MAEHPDWLQEAERGIRILDEGAEILAEMAEEGLPDPSHWVDAQIRADADGWSITIWADDGYAYEHNSGVSADDAAPPWFWDLYDYAEDFVEVEVDYEEAS